MTYKYLGLGRYTTCNYLKETFDAIYLVHYLGSRNWKEITYIGMFSTSNKMYFWGKTIKLHISAQLKSKISNPSHKKVTEEGLKYYTCNQVFCMPITISWEIHFCLFYWLNMLTWQRTNVLNINVFLILVARSWL